MATLGFVVAAALSLVLLTTLLNLLVFSYARGVVRAALDEGVRAGSRTTASAAECAARAEQVRADLLRGTLGDGVRMRCAETDDAVRADADVVLRGWLPTVPDWRFSLGATAVREHDPRP